MNKKTVKDIDLKGKRVLMRVDFNVPMERRRGDGRQAHQGGAADDSIRARAGRVAHRDEPPGPPQGRGLRGRVQPQARGGSIGQVAGQARQDGARLHRP